MTAPLDLDLTASTSPIRLLPVERHDDARGWFMETYSDRALADAGITCRFVQDNHSMSSPAYTVRGLHFQAPPHGQAKLVRCLRGRIFSVAVDLRAGSPSYGGWVGSMLGPADGQLFLPIGFAHGFLTLEPDCEILYKVSQYYAPHAQGSIRWDDPAIGIEWPLPSGASPVLSARDAAAIAFDAFVSPFDHDARPAA